ncbi:MAG: glycine cleavage system H protein [Gammaproteobacteria bacterium]
MEDNPGLINADPYGEGWLCQLAQDNTVDIDELIDSDEYAEQIEEE